MAFTVPEYLAGTARCDQGVRDWISGLPAIVAALADRWSLRVGEPFQPGGQCSWTAPVTDSAGAGLVLKVGFRFPGGEERDEAAGLRLWQGNGAVRLHAAHESESECALLIERCMPGTPLGQALHGDNVLAALRAPWLVIDPKPYIGNPRTTCSSTCSTVRPGWPPTRPRSPCGWRTWPGWTAAGSGSGCSPAVCRSPSARAGTGLTPYRGTAANLRNMAGLTIGKLAAGEGVGVETVRFYQRRGLLALPGRAGSGFREYTEDDRQRLAFIRRRIQSVLRSRRCNRSWAASSTSAVAWLARVAI